MAKRSAVDDSLLMYQDEFMVPNDIQLQRHLLKVYLDSPVGMHRGREATYGSLSCACAELDQAMPCLYQI